MYSNNGNFWSVLCWSFIFCYRYLAVWQVTQWLYDCWQCIFG